MNYIDHLTCCFINARVTVFSIIIGLFDIKYYRIFICYNNRVDVRGHKYVFGPTQTHFSPSGARVKMSLRRAKNIFMPKNINCITIIISLKGNIRHKNIKIDCKQSNSRLPASCIYFVVLLTTNCFNI